MAMGGLIYRLKQIAKLPQRFPNLQYPWLCDGGGAFSMGDVTKLGSRIHLLGKLPWLFSMVMEELICHLMQIRGRLRQYLNHQYLSCYDGVYDDVYVHVETMKLFYRQSIGNQDFCVH